MSRELLLALQKSAASRAEASERILQLCMRLKAGSQFSKEPETICYKNHTITVEKVPFCGHGEYVFEKQDARKFKEVDQEPTAVAVIVDKKNGLGTIERPQQLYGRQKNKLRDVQELLEINQRLKRVQADAYEAQTNFLQSLK